MGIPNMDELQRGLEISLHGPAREQALTACARILTDWDIAMPTGPPLVLDFGLGAFASTGLIEYWIANEAAAGYCAKYLFVFDGQTCPEHHHGRKMETFFIVKGEVKMTFNGEERTMVAGDTLPVAPGQVHGFTGVGPALLLEVSKPCEIDDNYFENTRIPIGGNYQGDAGS